MLKRSDPKVYTIIKKEEERQRDKLSLIPSENCFSVSVREAVGSVFSHKYSEGNIGQRYYEGNEYVDELEKLAIERACRLFKVPKGWTANVQALSGSNANLAVYLALLKEGDMLMSMYLPDGGHLSHGWSFEPDEKKRQADLTSGSLVYLGGERRVNLTSRLYKVVQYKTSPATKLFDYDELERIAQKYRPRLIITGGTAYPRNIDYRRMRKIADRVGAYYLADIAHEAGLVAAGVVPSPVAIADVVTMTTHKTLRAGRGAIIFANNELIEKINRGLMPGLQGGPHNHNIAGITVGLGEALRPEFKRYARQVVKNAKWLAVELAKQGFNIVTGGTDRHLLLVDLNDQPMLGKKFAAVLNAAGLVTNATTLPWDSSPPRNPAGLRLGTPWVTTRGMKEKEMSMIAGWIRQVMEIAGPWSEMDLTGVTKRATGSKEIGQVAAAVKRLGRKFRARGADTRSKV